MRRILEVQREINGEFQKVGDLLEGAGGIRFAYDQAYLQSPNAVSIATGFPLDLEAATLERTRAFFDGLLPEGPLRRQFDEAFRADTSDYVKVLAQLNFETAGALIFCEEGADPMRNRSYRPLDFIDLDAFATRPLPEAFNRDITSRLSLAGAQTKIGLMHLGDNMRQGWQQPIGSAPSTHILKACSGVFPGQTVNEALCMGTAAELEFEAAECQLIAIKGEEPLLAVKRFDRREEDGAPFPNRLHQEDLGQALLLAGNFKYEPTDGHYAALITGAINRLSSNPFGDRVVFFRRLLFDWLVGNCDNHLKNHSFVWSADWTQRELSPLYDVTCTTFYPALDKEMGVSLCPSRRVDEVTVSDLEELAKTVGIPNMIALAEAAELKERFLGALQAAEERIAAEGFPIVNDIASHIKETAEAKLKVLDNLSR